VIQIQIFCCSRKKGIAFYSGFGGEGEFELLSLEFALRKMMGMTDYQHPDDPVQHFDWTVVLVTSVLHLHQLIHSVSRTTAYFESCAMWQRTGVSHSMEQRRSSSSILVYQFVSLHPSDGPMLQKK
jgi:hypothetical protein